MDDISDIEAFYSRAPESEHERLLRHQLEYDLTWRYLERYLPATGTLLEVGAATGRYTVELARRGYRVTAVDLSAVELDIGRRQVTAAGYGDRVEYLVADARNLSALDERLYDAVLLMGPLYHLIHAPDRTLALAQAMEHLRPGGLLFSAHISRYGILGDLMKQIPEIVEDREELRSVIERGCDADDYPPGSFRGYLALVPEIIAEHESAGLHTLAMAAVEPAISADDASYNALAGERRQLWLDLLYEVSTDPSTVGASRHLLYVGLKPS